MCDDKRNEPVDPNSPAFHTDCVVIKNSTLDNTMTLVVVRLTVTARRMTTLLCARQHWRVSGPGAVCSGVMVGAGR